MSTLEHKDVGPSLSRDITAADIAVRRTFFSRHERTLLPLLTMIGLLALWELWGRLGNISPLFFSYPSRIVGGLLILARTTLLDDLRVSGVEFALGLGIALVGVPFGMIVGSSRRLRLALDPIITGAYATPTLTLTPLFVIWFGLGIVSKVALVAIMAFFPLAINTIEGVRTVDPTLIRAVRTFGAQRREVYTDVIFHAIVPFIVSGLRLAIGRAIIAVVIGEFIAATAGIGYRIRAMAAVFRTSEYLAGVAILVAAALLLNMLLKRLEAHLAPWRSESR